MMHFSTRNIGWVACLGIGLCGIFDGPAMATVTTSDPEEGGLANLADRLTWGATDDTSRRQKQEDILRDALECAVHPLHRAQAQLAWANWLLADATAGPATRWLLGFENNDDPETLISHCQEARERLSQAREAIKSIRTTELSDDEKKLRNRLLAAADTLEPFTELFAALADRDDVTKYKAACADAAVNLSAAREAEQASVAACARLWQSFGWAMADRQDRALLSLAPSLQKPEQYPYDYFSRLLRCRIVMDQGQYAATVALAIQMREQMETWFRSCPAPEQLIDARRLVALLQYRAESMWLKQLRQGNSPEANRLEKMRAELQKQFFPDNENAPLFCLERAVPIIVEPPEIRTSKVPRAVGSSTTPATQPASLSVTTSASAPGSEPSE